MFAVLGKRWTGLVIGVLLERPARFAEIARAIPGITESMLSARLTELKEAGLVTREVIEGPPIASLYRLTPERRGAPARADGARRMGARTPWRQGVSTEPPRVEGRIVAAGLTKVFGQIKAVDGLSFSVEPGSVTGFLGPNGAGKTTTLRMILGLAAPTSGTGTISGVTYAHLPAPGRMVGAVLEATSFHPGRSARNHLRVFCAAAGLPDRRADEVLELVGLTQAARYPVRGFSLGMRQRLGLATALLGNPEGPAPRRARQRSRSRGNRLAARTAPALRRRRWPDRADLQPCALGGRADGRSGCDHRARPAHL